jgi:hypothetical protein
MGGERRSGEIMNLLELGTVLAIKIRGSTVRCYLSQVEWWPDICAQASYSAGQQFASPSVDENKQQVERIKGESPTPPWGESGQ